MCLWYEGEGCRESNELASCLFNTIKRGLIYKDYIIIWSDNWAAQVKNHVMLFPYIFLVANGVCVSIQHKFLVIRHSFSDSYNDFGDQNELAKVWVWKIFENDVLNNILKPLLSSELFFMEVLTL